MSGPAFRLPGEWAHGDSGFVQTGDARREDSESLVMMALIRAAGGTVRLTRQDLIETLRYSWRFSLTEDADGIELRVIRQEDS